MAAVGSRAFPDRSGQLMMCPLLDLLNHQSAPGGARLRQLRCLALRLRMNLPQDHSQLSSTCLAGSLYSQYGLVSMDCHGGSTNIVQRSILLQKPVGVLITRFQRIGWAILCSECALLLMPFHPDTFNSDQSHTQHQQPKPLLFIVLMGTVGEKGDLMTTPQFSFGQSANLLETNGFCLSRPGNFQAIRMD